ncbi:beta-lactamase/transpeptidase-like protein [Phascolomyces articulosus]|uniref:Beta-lactamase/transpeptidase-like protein n=1 Tax=Phascolomyces articulosus TaxID=60185 RepID=A0AAD5JZ11_9FUNG|nr:beta-lactamase/transpeptidase-like protein [Phascolomyces articulosus]
MITGNNTSFNTPPSSNSSNNAGLFRRKEGKPSYLSLKIVTTRATVGMGPFLWKLLFQLTTLVLLLGFFALKRYFSHGAFTPWTCSVFGYKCNRLYSIPFHGYVHKDYVAAEEAFKENFYIGEEVGAATAVYVDGVLVIDMQGGWQDIDKRIPYTNNTLQLVFSCTKALASIMVAQFVEKGVLSYDEKISTYWPEFAQGNKENVTLDDLMQHAAGVGYLENGITSAEAEDPKRFSRILAEQPHTFGGVRQRSYHGATNGWYINEILKRVANCTVNDIADQYNKMYGIEWNLKPYEEEYDARISPLYMGPSLMQIRCAITRGGGFIQFIKDVLFPDQIFRKSLLTSLDRIDPSDYTTLRLRRIEGPSYSGYTNARSIAKLAAMMANRGKAIVDGEPDLLNDDTYDLVTQPVPLEYDLLYRRTIDWVKGGWGNYDDFAVEGVQFVGWGGVGGSTFFWNQELKIGFGYHMNGITYWRPPDDRSMRILRAVVKQVLKKKIFLNERFS